MPYIFRTQIRLLGTRLLAILVVLGLTACASHKPQPSAVPPAPLVKRDLTIAMLGATGLAGGYILDRALAEGYEVRVLARSPQKLDRYAGRIVVVKGDARDGDTIEALLAGADVVISALGPVRSDGDAAKMINSSVTAELIARMPEFGIKRYILLSGAAVVMPGDDRNFTGWLMRQLVQLRLHSELVDKQAEYQELANSSLDWTLVRCPLIEAEPFERPPRVSLITPSSFWLRAGELAEFVVEQIESDEYVREGPFLNSH